MPAEIPDALFDRLKGLLAPYADDLLVVTDAPDSFYLDARPSTQRPQGIFFASVQVKKNDVRFHLMPVYVHPDLLDNISDRLRRRMQGKSCFNFKTDDDALFAELAGLVAAGFDRYRQTGLVPADPARLATAAPARPLATRRRTAP